MIFDLRDIPVEVIRGNLSETLSEMVGVLSDISIITLVEEYGGQELYIPSKASSDSRLMQVIGQEEFTKLCASFQGNMVVVPRLRKLRLHYRNSAIVDENSKGSTVNVLASKYHISARQVKTILARSR